MSSAPKFADLSSEERCEIAAREQGWVQRENGLWNKPGDFVAVDGLTAEENAAFVATARVPDPFRPDPDHDDFRLWCDGEGIAFSVAMNSAVHSWSVVAARIPFTGCAEDEAEVFVDWLDYPAECFAKVEAVGYLLGWWTR